MVVHTHSERLVKYRQMILELLFSERNHVCAVGVMNGHCELQAEAALPASATSSPRAPARATAVPDASTTFFGVSADSWIQPVFPAMDTSHQPAWVWLTVTRSP